MNTPYGTVLSAKRDRDVIFCLQSYQGLKIDRSLNRLIHKRYIDLH